MRRGDRGDVESVGDFFVGRKGRDECLVKLTLLSFWAAVGDLVKGDLGDVGECGKTIDLGEVGVLGAMTEDRGEDGEVSTTVEDLAEDGELGVIVDTLDDSVELLERELAVLERASDVFVAAAFASEVRGLSGRWFKERERKGGVTTVEGDAGWEGRWVADRGKVGPGEIGVEYVIFG